MGNFELDRIKAVMLGHAVGDALGVPVEFKSRAALDKNPVTDMTGFGTFPVPAGAWSDDTSMALCALDVLADGEFDCGRIMDNFADWYRKGAFTPTGVTFDIGTTCAYAIENYVNGEGTAEECGITGEYANGNGSLMRIHPFALYLHYCRGFENARAVDLLSYIHRASALTHAHERSQIGCGIFAILLWEILDGGNIDTALRRTQDLYAENPEISHYTGLFDHLSERPRSEIKSSGYIVDTLEAALWCLLTTDSYRECVLKAVNLGEDTDSVAGVAGALAGAHYGFDAIPEEWLDTLIKRDEIENLCEKAYHNWQNIM